MISCNAVREQLPDYIYELLSDRQLQEVSRHLDGCLECARLHGQMVRQFQLLDCWEVPGPAEGGLARLREALRRQEMQRDAAGQSALIAWWQRLGRTRRARLPQPLQPRLSFAPVALTALVLLALGTLPFWQGVRQQLLAAQKRSEISTLVTQGRLRDAVIACRAWARSGPEQASARGLLKSLEMRLSHYVHLEAELTKVVQADPGASRERVRLAEALRVQGKTEQARLEYQRAVQTNESCVEAYVGLATLAHAAGRKQEARSYLDMASRIAPDDPRVISTAARVQTPGGGAAETAARFWRAVQYPGQGRADGLLGLAGLVRQTGGENLSQNP